MLTKCIAYFIVYWLLYICRDPLNGADGPYCFAVTADGQSFEMAFCGISECTGITQLSKYLTVISWWPYDDHVSLFWVIMRSLWGFVRWEVVSNSPIWRIFFCHVRRDKLRRKRKGRIVVARGQSVFSRETEVSLHGAEVSFRSDRARSGRAEMSDPRWSGIRAKRRHIMMMLVHVKKWHYVQSEHSLLL